MTIRAIFFDFGGVLVRTEDKEPRTRLAERFGMTYREIEATVFGGESSRRASLGEITEAEHLQICAETLGVPKGEADALARQFFAGDVIDHTLLDFVRSLRPGYKVGLISNAWSGLRSWMAANRFDDVFDHMVISAEVGLMKPGAAIYIHALEKLATAPAEAVFVDDFEENIAGARAVGMHAVHFTDATKALEELKSLLNQ